MKSVLLYSTKTLWHSIQLNILLAFVLGAVLYPAIWKEWFDSCKELCEEVDDIWFDDQVQSDGPEEAQCKQDWCNNTPQSHLCPIESKHILISSRILDYPHLYIFIVTDSMKINSRQGISETLIHKSLYFAVIWKVKFLCTLYKKVIKSVQLKTLG